MRALKIIILTSIFLGLILGGAWYLVQQRIPNVRLLTTHYPHVRYFAKEKRFEIELLRNRPAQWVGIKEVSRAALGAIIVSEDWAFFQHSGYDPNQLQIVIQETLEKGKFGRGASTITQQVVKNVFLNNERSIIRKLFELVLAIELDREVSKSRILETYINIAEMGPGIFGIGPAARYYFSKPASALTAKEGAFLAMLLPSPVRYSQSFRERRLTRFARRTVDTILGKMVQAGYVSAEERALLATKPLAFETVPDPVPGEELSPEEQEFAGDSANESDSGVDSESQENSTTAPKEEPEANETYPDLNFPDPPATDEPSTI